MIRPLCRDTLLLSKPAEKATAADLPTVQDLRDTLLANADRCVGMAANMIGVLRRFIAVVDGEAILVMLNPEIVKSAKPYRTEEGCLSLDGVRKTTRYREIAVRYAFQETEMLPELSPLALTSASQVATRLPLPPVSV